MQAILNIDIVSVEEDELKSNSNIIYILANTALNNYQATSCMLSQD